MNAQQLVKGNTYTVNGLAGYRFDFACRINAGRTWQFWFSNGYFTQAVCEQAGCLPDVTQ